MPIIQNFLLSLDKSFASAADLFDFSRGRLPPGTLTTAFWPGIVRTLMPQFKKGVVGITGTNGKHTTCRILSEIFHQADALTLNSYDLPPSSDKIISTLVRSTNQQGMFKADYGVFGIDIPDLEKSIKLYSPHTVILNNLYDDYFHQAEEPNKIKDKCFEEMTAGENILVNSDDPILCGGFPSSILPHLTYFGVEDIKLNLENSPKPDISCPRCNTRLNYQSHCLAHLGDYSCQNCGWERPLPTIYAINVSLKSDGSYFRLITPGGPLDVSLRLSGLHNVYNAVAAAAAAFSVGMELSIIRKGLETATPLGGRDERIVIHGREARLMTIKNRTSLQETIRTCLLDPRRGHYLFLLDETIKYGGNGPWIQDDDLSNIRGRSRSIHLAGAGSMHLTPMDEQRDSDELDLEGDASDVFHNIMRQLPSGDQLWVLATEDLMFSVRQELKDMNIL